MTKTLCAALVLVVSILAAASPAAADSRIGLSRDGTSWGSGLADPLFDSSLRWVPGDSRTAEFLVRNESGDPAELSVDVLGPRLDSLLGTGDVTISAQGAGGPWREVSTPGTHRLITDVAARPGVALRVSVEVALDSGSTNQSMRRELDLQVHVRLTQDASADDNHGVLPDTGAPALWSVFIGLVLLAGGLSLTPRRRERNNHHVES